MVGEAFTRRLERTLESWSDRCNPIVVKETRQALRSWSFPLTFLVMLLFCWGVSIQQLFVLGEAVYYGSFGPRFFGSYYAVLLLGLCLVVPTGLFRSVTAEFEGQTFEMVVITALRPRNIVFGKMKAAVVQMGAYYSAVAPFLCFTYLLQGVTVWGILMALFLSLFAGLSACQGSIMLASLSKQTAWQVVCQLISLVWGVMIFGVTLSLGEMVVSEIFGGTGFWSLCAGCGCLGYPYLIYCLLTINVSIAQFTPSVPPLGDLPSVIPEDQAAREEP